MVVTSDGRSCFHLCPFVCWLVGLSEEPHKNYQTDFLDLGRYEVSCHDYLGQNTCDYVHCNMIKTLTTAQNMQESLYREINTLLTEETGGVGLTGSAGNLI